MTTSARDNTTSGKADAGFEVKTIVAITELTAAAAIVVRLTVAALFLAAVVAQKRQRERQHTELADVFNRSEVIRH